jgi:hypothetical protein
MAKQQEQHNHKPELVQHIRSRTLQELEHIHLPLELLP